MITKQAIEKAIEGGWQNRYGDWQWIACDPTFWQALGKALGWGWECEECGAGALGPDSFHCLDCQKIVRLKPTWLVKAHRFCDLVYGEKPTEQFWDEILK